MVFMKRLLQIEFVKPVMDAINVTEEVVIIVLNVKFQII